MCVQKLIEWTLPERGEGAGAFTDALGVYKTTLAHIYAHQKRTRKRRAEDPVQQRWTQATARDELAAIHTKLCAEYTRIVELDEGPDRAAAITQVLHCAVIFGIDPTDKMPSLRGGNWPLVRYGEAAVHPFLGRTGHSLDMTDEGAVLHAPDSTKPPPGPDPRPITFNVDEVSPKIGTLLAMLKPYAMRNRDAWVFPPQKRCAYLYHRGAATLRLLGVSYTSNDGRHLSYCADHGNPCERELTAARRGSTAAAAAAYGGGRC
jgi:hypothetical protein